MKYILIFIVMIKSAISGENHPKDDDYSAFKKCIITQDIVVDNNNAEVALRKIIYQIDKSNPNILESAIIEEKIIIKIDALELLDEKQKIKEIHIKTGMNAYEAIFLVMTIQKWHMSYRDGQLRIHKWAKGS